MCAGRPHGQTHRHPDPLPDDRSFLEHTLAILRYFPGDDPIGTLVKCIEIGAGQITLKGMASDLGKNLAPDFRDWCKNASHGVHLTSRSSLTSSLFAGSFP